MYTCIYMLYFTNEYKADTGQNIIHDDMRLSGFAPDSLLYTDKLMQYNVCSV